MKPNVEVRVSDLIQPGLTIRGPYGTGEPMALRAPWDGAELALVSTATLADIDVVLDRARAARGSSSRSGSRRWDRRPSR